MSYHEALDTLFQQPLVEQARRIAEQYSMQAEQTRELSSEVVDALTSVGFARYFVPCEYGGLSGSFADLSLKLMAVSTGCTSAAWCAAIQAVTGRMAAYLPTVAQQQIWANGPDVRISASFRSTGTVQTVKDGWRLSGTWHYLSGIDHAQWILLCINPQGNTNESRFAAIPVGSWQVFDDWHTLGMRGTGSRSIKLEGVTVPTYMTFLHSDLMSKGYSRYASGPQYQVAPIGVDPQLFMSCAFGAALAGLQQWEKYLNNHDVPNEAAIIYSKAATALDICYLLLENSCLIADKGTLSRLEAARNARDASFAAQLVLDALNHIFRLGGAHAHFDTSPIQRSWRDVQTLTAHIGLRPESNFINYAKLALNHQV